MQLSRRLTRLAIAAVMLGSLGACAVAPYPVAYRAQPVYVESYPTYRSGYYEQDHRRYDNRYDDRYGRGYRDDRRYESRRADSPFEDAARVHREIRQSLGLPRLPGMP